MSLIKKNKIYHYDFKVGGTRFQGSTGKKNRREAEAVERDRKDQAGEEIERRRALAADRARRVPTVREVVSDLVEGRSSRAGLQAHWISKLRTVAFHLGEDRLVNTLTGEDLTRLIAAERLRMLLWRKRPSALRISIEQDLFDHNTHPHGEEVPTPLSTSELIEYEPKLKKRLGPTHKSMAYTTVNLYFIVPFFMIVECAIKDLKVPMTRPERRSFKGTPGARNKVLNFDDEQKLIEVSTKSGMWPVWDFALASLFRRQNLMDLRWEDVDFDLSEIRGVQKRGAKLTREMNEDMRDILTELKRVKHPSGYVFTMPDKDNGGLRVPLTPHVSKLFTADLKAAGLLGFRLHDMRRTGATRMYKHGGDISAVQNATGHANVSQTWKYVGLKSGDHAHAERKRSVLDRFYRDRARRRAAGEAIPELTAREEVMAEMIHLEGKTMPAERLLAVVDHARRLAIRASMQPATADESSSSANMIDGTSRWLSEASGDEMAP